MSKSSLFHFPIFWWICFSLFWLHQIAQRLLHWSIPLVDSYLDPLLCMPVLLGILSKERSLVLGRTYRLPLFDLIVIVIFLSLIFELGFPKWSSAFFYDPLDFVAYGVGALLYYFLTEVTTS